MRQIRIQTNEAGQRFDKYLAKYLNKAPKSFLYKMLRKKNIVLNGKKSDGSEKLVAGDEVKLFLAEETIEKFIEQTNNPSKRVISSQVPSTELLLETAHVCFMNKPWGVLSQKAKDTDISMNEIFLNYLLDSGQLSEDELRTFRPAVCNRLDRNTTGIIIGGKTLYGLQRMSALLKERRVKKFYQCIVAGQMQGERHIEGWLRKDEAANQVAVTDRECAGGSYIQTNYRVLSSNGVCSLLEVQLITGKSHQIRAHLASIGHPVIGDTKYGSRKVNEEMRRKYRLKHQLLHSCRLEFPKLEGEYEALEELSGQVITAPLPAAFREIVKGEGL